MRKFTVIRVISILAIFLIIGCTFSRSDVFQREQDSIEDHTYFPESKWRTSTPEEQGMDSQQLIRMIQSITDQKSKLHSIVIIRNGFLVLNANFYPYRGDLIHVLQSSSKSVTSALIGVAITEGKINDIHNKVLPYFTDWQMDDIDPRKKEMTIQHLLTMTAGFDWQESSVSYGSKDNSYSQATLSDNPLLFELNRPMKETPGAIFNYNTGATDLLSDILEKATNQSALDYARTKLFEPIGIQDVHWSQYKTGDYLAGAGLYLKPVDMAKFGYLYLNNGKWKDRQILSEEWIRESTRNHVKSNMFSNWGYGYQWWIPSNNTYSAQGSGGQTINILPDYNMVVVTTGSTSDYNLPSRLLDTYIIPSLLSKPIQKESASSHSLQKVLQEASRPSASPLTEIPPFAKEISGKTYYFDKEKFFVTFHFPNNEAGSITTESNGMKRTYSFGYNGSYLTFNDQAQLSAHNHVVATATFDQSSLILQQRSLQNIQDVIINYNFQQNKLHLKAINLYFSTIGEESVGTLVE